MCLNHDALVNSVRRRLNELAQELLEGEGAEPVPADPDINYLLELGAGMWERADNVDSEGRTYIDGYWGQCHWNAAMTAVRRAGGVPAIGANQSALIVASSVRIFRGYAYYYSPDGQGNGWAMNSWCMDGNTILETTGPMSAYFGTELNAEERQVFANHVAAYNPTLGHGGLGWGLNHEGTRLWMPAARVADSIGLPSVVRPPDAEEVAELDPEVGPDDPGLLRTWHLDGFLPVDARTKSEARALFKKQGRIPPGAKIE